MDKFLDSVKLMARTGQFFAKSDGHYDATEERFLKGFTYSLGILADLKNEERKDVRNVLNEDSEFNELINDTQQLLEQYDDEKERQRMLEAFDQFIRVTIGADGKIEREEAKHYKEWRRRMGLPENRH